MTEPQPLPIIGVPADVKAFDGLPFHAVGDKYLRAITEATRGIPLVIPAFGELYDLPDLLGRLDGVLFTGSPSNVHPTHYGVAPSPEAEPYDHDRDATTLPMIRETIARGIPMLAICRGMQELNVALGGTLHARVHELEGREDHRRPQHPELDVQYGPKHPIQLVPGGAFHALAGATELTVNSLHWQGVDSLAPGLVLEAEAPDGTVEAVSVRDASNFALGVQWHPEYKVMENAFSVKLFTAFGDAARARAQARRDGRLAEATLPTARLTA